MVRFAHQVVKIPSGVFEQVLLVTLDGEVVMRVALLNQIPGHFALGQQGVGGNGFAADVDGRQQRDGGLDFVGLLFLLAALYGQGAHFFWV